MPRTCTICIHPQRAAIDAALVSGGPYRRIALRFAASPDSVNRHKAHIPGALARAHEAGEVIRADDLLSKLRRYEQTAERIERDAERNDDRRTALLAIDKLLKIAQLMAEMTGELRQRQREDDADPLTALPRERQIALLESALHAARAG